MKKFLLVVGIFTIVATLMYFFFSARKTTIPLGDDVQVNYSDSNITGIIVQDSGPVDE